MSNNTAERNDGTELTNEQFWKVAQTVAPHITRAEFDSMWAEFAQLKRAGAFIQAPPGPSAKDFGIASTPLGPVLWQYQHRDDSAMEWRELVPRALQTIDDAVRETLGFKDRDGNPLYRVRTLYATPPAAEILRLADEYSFSRARLETAEPHDRRYARQDCDEARAALCRALGVSE